MEENTVLEPQTEPSQPQVEAAQPAKEKGRCRYLRRRGPGRAS